MGNHMATGFASALSEGQPAQLDLGDDAVPCLVVGFQGSDVMLAPGAELAPAAIGQRTMPSLLIEAGAMLPALKAAIRPGYGEGELVATLLDPFRLGQRRNFSRAPIVLPAHLRPLGDDEEKPWTTFTRDVSAGGLRVARQSGYRESAEAEGAVGRPACNPARRARARAAR